MKYPEYISFEKLEECHPEVEDNKEMYETIDTLLEGGTKLKRDIEKYLVRKPDEDDEIYKFRKRIFTYEPIVGKCLAQLMNRLVQANYVVEGLPREGKEGIFWKRIRENLDGQGTKEKDFLECLFFCLVKYRRAFILVDKPEYELVPQNLREEYEMGIHPYAVVYGQNTVTHFKETDGRLEWVKIRKLIHDYSPVGETKHYLEWTFIDSTDMATYKIEVEKEDRLGCGCKWIPKTIEINPKNVTEKGKVPVKLINQVEHERGEIPIIKVELPQNLYVTKEAYFLALEHIRIHNNLNYTAIVAGQIQRLFTPLSEDPNTTVDIEAAKLQTGNDRVLIGKSFSYNETTGAAIETISSYSSRIESRIRDIIFSNGMSNDSTRPMQESGVAKSMDFKSQEQALQKYGEYLINTLESIYRMIARQRVSTELLVDKISVSGMNEFVLDSIDSKIERILTIEQLELSMPDTGMRLLLEDLVRSLNPFASTEEQDIIKDEIHKIFNDPEFPDLETQEVISLVQNQIISNNSARDMLGFSPEKEEKDVENQMLTMADVEKEIAERMGTEEDTEEDEEEIPEAEIVVALAKSLSKEVNLTSEEILKTVEFNQKMDKEDLTSIAGILAEQLSEETGVTVEEILNSLNNQAA